MLRHVEATSLADGALLDTIEGALLSGLEREDGRRRADVSLATSASAITPESTRRLVEEHRNLQGGGRLRVCVSKCERGIPAELHAGLHGAGGQFREHLAYAGGPGEAESVDEGTRRDLALGFGEGPDIPETQRRGHQLLRHTVGRQETPPLASPFSYIRLSRSSALARIASLHSRSRGLRP